MIPVGEVYTSLQPGRPARRETYNFRELRAKGMRSSDSSPWMAE